MTSKPYTFDRVVRILIGVAIIGGILWLLNVLKDVLLPFLVACLIAYLLEPFVQYNRSLLKLKGRFVAILVTLVEVITFFGILSYFLVPSIMEEMHLMGKMLHNYSTSDVTIKFLPPELHHMLKSHIDFEMLAQKIGTQDMNAMMNRAMALINGGLHVVLAIMGWLIVFLYVIFIMLDYDRLMLGFRVMVPPRYRKVVYKVGADIKNSMNHYFRGQALISCIVSVVYCGGFWLAGLPLAVVVGLGTAVLFMIPYCQFLSIVPVTLLCLVDSANGTADFWTMWWECMGVFALVQIIGDLILIPRIMGKVMGLNPAIILLSLSVWGTLLGFIGMIIALPLTTLLLSYYEQYIILRNPAEPPAEREQEVQDLKDMTKL